MRSWGKKGLHFIVSPLVPVWQWLMIWTDLFLLVAFISVFTGAVWFVMEPRWAEQRRAAEYIRRVKENTQLLDQQNAENR